MKATTTLDATKLEDFGEKILGDVSAMILGNLAYIGDRLDLFEIMAQQRSTTSEELAEAASCHPRYIREWLSAMAAAEWVEYDAQHDTFTLPPEHAAFLADEHHPMFMGGVLESVVPFAQTTPGIMECFRNGGGVSFTDHHPDMPRIIERFSAPLYENYLTEVWLPDLLPDVHQTLAAGGEVADVGCGSGRALVELAKAYPKSRFSGYEPNAPSAERAQALVKTEEVDDRVTVHNGEAGGMPDARYDFITTFDVIHDLVDPQAVIEDIRRALKPEGTYLMLEINASEDLEDMLHPLGTFFYSISTMYCLTVSLAHDGAGIGTCMGERLPREMCEKAGFSHFRKLDFEGHPFPVLYEVRG